MLTTLLTWHLATTGVLLAALVLVVAVQGTTARARALRTALHTARSRSSARAARIVRTYAATGRVENGVNLADQTPATHLLTVRHLDRVGVLAGVLGEMREAGWNVQEMENLVFQGAEAACARIRFDGQPDDGTLERIRAVDNVLNATVLAL